MRKRQILSVILALCLLSAVFFAFPAAAEETGSPELPETPAEPGNVLLGNVGQLESIAAVTSAAVLTDGVRFDTEVPSAAYLNQRVYVNEKSAIAAEQTGGAFPLTLADGTVNRYYYTVTWRGLYADVTGFSLFFCGEDPVVNPVCHFPNYQIDAAFDLLVSRDNGDTWAVAFASERLTYAADSSGTVTAMAGFTREEGQGNAVEVRETEPDNPGKIMFTYRTVSVVFAETFENVTDIAYGCVSLRRSGKIVDTVDGETLIESRCIPRESAWHFAARISEAEVYGTAKEKPVITTAVAETETEAPSSAITSEPVTSSGLVTEAPVSSSAVTTEAPELSTPAEPATAAETKVPETEKEDVRSSGCGASFGAAALPLLPMGAWLLGKKRRMFSFI